MSDIIDINVTKIEETIDIIANFEHPNIDITTIQNIDNIEVNATPNVVQVNINTIIGSGANWGEIEGNLSNQTDLQNALDLKANISSLGATAFSNDYNDLDNLPTIPSQVTSTSDLINDGADGINPFITLEDIPPVTGFIPYTGATQNVDLGEYELKAGQFEFDQTPTGTSGVGVMRWNDTDGTLDLGLKGGNVTLQIGQEQVARVVNKTATNITLLESNYQVVKIIGATGQRLSVDLAQANNDLNSATTLGVVTETIANNQEGFITTGGQVKEINTTGSLQSETWSDGDVLYLSPTTAGKITNIKPTAPNHTIIVGYVEYAHAIHGKIFVKVDNGYELEELHNVTSTNYTTPIDTDSVLTFDVTNSLWKRLSWSNIKSNLKTYFDTIYQTALGYTPENITNKSTSTTLGTSNTLYPTQNAVKSYVDDSILSDFYNKSAKVVIEWVPYASAWGNSLVPAVTGTASNTSPIFGGGGLGIQLLKQFRRRYDSASTAGSSTSFRDSSFRQAFINEGFVSFFIFGNEDVANVSQARSFCGFQGGNGEIGNINPSTITNAIGVANDSGQANLRFIVTDAAALNYNVDLGSSFPANTNSADFYLLILINDKGVSNLKWRVVNLHSGADSGYSTITTGLPASTVGLAPHVWRNNGSTALAVRNTLVMYRLLKL